jgi:hypothetical protein
MPMFEVTYPLEISYNAFLLSPASAPHEHTHMAVCGVGSVAADNMHDHPIEIEKLLLQVENKKLGQSSMGSFLTC